MAASENEQKNSSDFDCESAFPTAQLVACWRAIDAASAKPKIGTNIGGGPDLAAKIFTGEVGENFSADYIAALGIDASAVADMMARRTRYFDKLWMDAKNDGIKQFVVLAAGLDARAWRLPNLSGVTVYELDVPRSHIFKRTKIPLLDMYELECERVEIEVDLADPSWRNTLISHGFNPKERSFFLMEGLTMYLPPAAPAVLFQAVSDIMTPGSVFAGDALTGSPESWMETPGGKVMEKYGAKWEFCVENEEELASRLNDVGFEPDVSDLLQNVSLHKTSEQNEAEDLEVDETKAMEFRDKIITVTKTMPNWPSFAKPWVKEHYENGDEGIKCIAQEMCKDAANTYGLINESAAMKKRVGQLVLDAGFIDIVRELAPKFIAETGGGLGKYIVFEAKKRV